LRQKNVCQVYLHLVKKSKQRGPVKIFGVLETGFTFIRRLKLRFLGPAGKEITGHDGNSMEIFLSG
jgi:hypothetical protein